MHPAQPARASIQLPSGEIHGHRPPAGIRPRTTPDSRPRMPPHGNGARNGKFDFEPALYYLCNKTPKPSATMKRYIATLMLLAACASAQAREGYSP